MHKIATLTFTNSCFSSLFWHSSVCLFKPHLALAKLDKKRPFTIFPSLSSENAPLHPHGSGLALCATGSQCPARDSRRYGVQGETARVSHCSPTHQQQPPLLCSWALTVSPHIKHSPREGGVSTESEREDQLIQQDKTLISSKTFPNTSFYCKKALSFPNDDSVPPSAEPFQGATCGCLETLPSASQMCFRLGMRDCLAQKSHFAPCYKI